MKYKIVNHQTIDFMEAVGISPERQKVLSAHLDEMVKEWDVPSGVRVVKVCDIMERIASFCDNIEEFSYCVMLHMGWHQRRGMILTPRR